MSLYRQFMNKIFDNVFDLLFPKFCLGCNKEGEWLCETCQAEIVPVITQICPGCKRISKAGRFCKKCRKRVSLNGVLVGAYFDEGPIKELIHNLKYNSVPELAKILGSLSADNLEQNLNFLGKDPLIIPVPLHFLRRAKRGYNQSELLADVIAAKINLPKNFKILKKIRKTKPQVLTDSKKRRKNVLNSFKIINKKGAKGANDAKGVCGKTVILIDDVLTTGATLNECARALKEAGAKKVWGLVVARG